MKLLSISMKNRDMLFSFKRILVKNFDNLCPSYSIEYMLGGKSGEDYFQKLDAFVDTEVEDKNNVLKYFYVTLLIEERALQLYDNYNKILNDKEQEFNLNSLIKEELNHLQETQKELNRHDKLYQDRIQIFRARRKNTLRFF